VPGTRLGCWLGELAVGVVAKTGFFYRAHQAGLGCCSLRLRPCASHLLNERKRGCLRRANRMPSLRGAGRGMSRFREKANMKREAAARNRPARMGARRFLARRRVRNRFRLGVSGQYRRRQSLLKRRSGVVLANGKERLSGILWKSVGWGFAPSYSAHVRLGEHGAPVLLGRFCGCVDGCG
jgi:hypothetical protein